MLEKLFGSEEQGDKQAVYMKIKIKEKQELSQQCEWGQGKAEQKTSGVTDVF